jgi:hypothetical protein
VNSNRFGASQDPPSMITKLKSLDAQPHPKKPSLELPALVFVFAGLLYRPRVVL